MVQCSQLDRTLVAISDPTRRQMLTRLGGSQATVSELAQPFGMTITGARKHLRVLERAGLVSSEKVGRARVCTLGPRRLEDVAAWVVSYERMLDERLDRLGALIGDDKGADDDQ